MVRKQLFMHPCPGCGEDQLARVFVCRPCFEYLPRVDREALERAWGTYGRRADSLALAMALTRVLDWLRLHPRKKTEIEPEPAPAPVDPWEEAVRKAALT